MRSVGIQCLVNHPEQLIESNTEHSWQCYLERMSCQGTWADAIIIQAVANCVNSSIHIAESNPTFSPVTVVESVNVTNTLNIYIGHLAEIHCFHSRKHSNGDKRKSNKKITNQLMTEKNVKRKYMKDRRAECHMAQNVIISLIFGLFISNLDTKKIFERSSHWKHKIIPPLLN